MPTAQMGGPKRAVRAALCLLLSAALILGNALAPIGAGVREAAAADGVPATVPYASGKKVPYDAFFTHRMEAGGRAAYCADPETVPPPDGTYRTKSPAVPPTDDAAWNTERVAAIMWFGYGGPGFDKSMFPSKWHDGTAMTANRYYALTHIAISFAWTRDTSQACFGCSKSFVDWIRRHITGSVDGQLVYPDSFVHIANGDKDRVPKTFKTFTVGGSGYQTIIGCSYNPEVKVNFTKVSADASMTDGNKQYSVAGAEYDIYLARTGKVVSHIKMDSKGKATLNLLPNEEYYAVETKAPKGFKLNKKRIEFRTGNSSSAERLADDPGYVMLRVRKRDSSGAGQQPGLSLAGAEFTLTDSLGKKHLGKTDEDGYVFFGRPEVDGAIPFGKISIVETKAPEGYELDSTVRTLTVDSKGMTDAGVIEMDLADDVMENPVAFDITIAKTKGGEDPWDGSDGHAEPAKGVRFEIVSGTTGEVVGSVTTNRNGFASTKDPKSVNAEAVSDKATSDPKKPWMGTGKRVEGVEGALPYDPAGYTVREVPETVPEGFDRVEDWKITADQMESGAELQYSVIDKTLDTRLKIVKVDEETGNTIPAAGFSFQVLDADGEPVTMTDWYPNETKLDTFTTDGSGVVTLPERLPAGKYSIKEVATAAPYLLNGETVPFEVTGDYAGAEPVTVVRVADRQAMGRAEIVKTCSDDGAALAGAEFDVIAKEDVVSPDGTVRAVAGQVVDHVVTGEAGTAVTGELYLGKGTASYAFVETKPPSGHAIDLTEHPFELKHRDESTPVVEASVSVEDRPTELEVLKKAESDGGALEGAVFAMWDAKDEVSSVGAEGDYLTVRAEKGKRVEAASVVDGAYVLATAPDGVELVLTDPDGSPVETATPGSWHVPQGVYALSALVDGRAHDLGGVEIKARDGKRYDVAVTEGLLGLTASQKESGAVEPIALSWAAEDGAYSAQGVTGRVRVTVDGRSVGEIDCAGKTFAEVRDGSISTVPVLLKGGAEPETHVTDADGRIGVKHLAPGTYRVREVTAPKGYVVDPGIKSFTVSEDGLIDGEASHAIEVKNDNTKVDISKRDIANEDELPGAKLTVLDSEGEAVESWVSGDEPHRIEILPPGEYTLVEEVSPRSYDKAVEVPFTVLPTAEVQTVIMHDEPIEVSGEVDKRQEIADPTAPGTEANGDGGNRAEVTESEDGAYEYSVDFRSTSSTWVDEFTVTDEIAAAAEGLATLEGIVTPRAGEDFDGKLNVWYRTETEDAPEEGDEAEPRPDEGPDGSGDGKGDARAPEANATLGDGHENPWLSDDGVRSEIGEDGRAVDYEGWRLWAEGVDSEEATELDVADLELADGEQVVAVRLEYGRVEEGFSSRAGGWDREDLKNPHDDVDDVHPEHEGDALGKGTAKVTLEDGTRKDVALSVLEAAEDGAGWMLDLDGDGAPEFYGEDSVDLGDTVLRAPLVLRMRATGEYREGTALENAASVDIYRNGGGEGLEDHDADRVVQAPASTASPLPQTGVPAAGGALAGAAACGAAAVAAWSRRRPKVETYDRFGDRTS